MADPGKDRWEDRIVCDPKIHHGSPTIRGTRVTVSVIVGCMAESPVEEILRNWPQITADDIKAALYYASRSAETDFVFSV